MPKILPILVIFLACKLTFWKPQRQD